ncbi:MAG: isoprenylcysteine carboxylmethyltransferase family protein [Acidobacteriota bacterium]
MDRVRYYLALLLVVFTPPAILFWFSIHPFIRFWRRVGPRLTLAIHYALLLLMAGGLYLVRKPLLTAEFGTSPFLIALAVPVYVLVVALRFKLGKHLRARILTGLPELAPEKYERRLLTEGIYSRIRHPRYVQVFLALLAYAMAANYLAGYVLLALSALWILLLVRIEEKELRDRFGAEYEAYCARVPRFIPRRGRD